MNKPFITLPSSYLMHVNGLRGLAIIMVFLYHMQESLAPHGFIGVDIFLVISGYLMLAGFMKKPGEVALGAFIAVEFLPRLRLAGVSAGE